MNTVPFIESLYT